MGLVLIAWLTSVIVGSVAVCADEAPSSQVVEPTGDVADNSLANTELVLAFVIFRHGDRTPDSEEIALFPSKEYLSPTLYFPYGKKALTNKGKQRSYFVGKYLREMYDGLISQLYLPDEIVIRTTDYARTKMTALTALAAMYPPVQAQKWNPNLDWQPIPYNALPYAEDDLLYWYNCDRYLKLRDTVYGKPEVHKWIEPYQGLFRYLSEHTKTNITKPEDVFYLDNLFQTLSNVGVTPPKWAQDVMPKIKEMTKIEYAIENYNADLVRLASGVLMQFIQNQTNAVVQNTTKTVEPKLYLFSAHENNVASLMAAAKVFEAHQPHYGSTFSIELRRNLLNNEYGISTVYARDAGGPPVVLPIKGCGGQMFCDYDKFLSLTEDVSWSIEEYYHACNTPV